MQKGFYSETVGSSLIRERVSRAEQLYASIQSSASNLFRLQLDILYNQVTDNFKKSIIQLARVHPEVPKEEALQVMRKLTYDFQMSASELELVSLGFNSTEVQNELTTNLKTILEDFSDSPAGKLEAVRKFDNQAKRSQRQKQKGINIGLNLVGMFRPPGNGGLQGFAGYSTGIFGLPLELLLGVQNDGDSPDVIHIY